MDFGYKKDDNNRLFKGLEENPNFGIVQPQNYIPLYNYFFSLNNSNYNNITLKNKWKLSSLISQESNNIFDATIKNDKIKKNKSTYLKFSPLLDPVKYLLGKYDMEDKTLFNLPTLDVSNCNPKVNNYNNMAYVDSFFSYLTSNLYHHHGFLNGIDFYGSFLAIKNDFRINIIDDFDYLNESAFFRKSDKILYELEYIDLDSITNDTRNHRKKIIIEDSSDNILDNNDDVIILNLSDVSNIEEINNIVSNETGETVLSECELNNFDITKKNENNEIETTKIQEDTSSCSSRTSNTTIETNEEQNEEENEEENEDGVGEDNSSMNDENNSDYEDMSSEEDEEGDDDELIAIIKSFPVEVISLERCENTLDSFMNSGDITDEIWNSIVLQILFSLITFQNTFHMTHNDLHTNNIMYIETEKKYLYYKLNHVYYRVPTYGKIYKIIDFGRSIYKFRGQILCSDSFAKDGDAATQYNCEPYLNNKKPRLEPSYSFDLCRLGCALYDYLIDEPKTQITKIILDWVKDDKGRNILYKKNGDERYPDFKLYKMIARAVSKHIPADVLQKPYFDKFIVNKNELKKNSTIIDIDSIPCYAL